MKTIEDRIHNAVAEFEKFMKMEIKSLPLEITSRLKFQAHPQTVAEIKISPARFTILGPPYVDLTPLGFPLEIHYGMKPGAIRFGLFFEEEDSSAQSQSGAESPHSIKSGI